MMSSGNAVSSHGGLIPSETLYEKRACLFTVFMTLKTLPQPRQLRKVPPPLGDFRIKTPVPRSRKTSERRNGVITLPW